MSKITKIIRRTKRQEVGLLRRPDGTKCTNTEEVLNLLLMEHFPQCLTNTVDTSVPNTHRTKVKPLPWINLERVKSGIDLFGPHKAAGPDDIKPIVLQNLSDNILEGIVRIFTACMTLGYTPMRWKMASEYPSYKSQAKQTGLTRDRSGQFHSAATCGSC